MHDFAKYDCQISKMVVSYSRGATSFYYLKNEYESYGKKFFEKVKNNPALMFKVLEEVDKTAEAVFKLGKKFAYVDFKKLNDKKILKIHNQLFKLDEILWRRGQIQNLLELHNNYLTEHIKGILEEKFGKNNVVQYFDYLTRPSYKSMSIRQDEDFLKMLKKYRQGVKDKSLMIKNHWKKYSWMIYGWAGPAFEIKYFENNFKEALKAKINYVKSKSDINKDKVAAKTRLWVLSKMDEKEKRLAVLLRTLVDMKLKRVDAHSLTFFIADKINAEIAKRKFISVNQIRTVPALEMRKLMSGKITKEEMNRDYEFVLYWFEKGKKVRKINGIEAKVKITKILASIPGVKKSNLIKGEMAYAGKVRGKIKVILEQKDFRKFKRNEILVTRITDPSYVPIMKMAQAIITDIGGITCHAAIVSRELKKPCVIGTKIATKVLKDGDLVEVDAEKGVVKIIK